jgi:pimeloyl-ACP methyl ester carboxylesterase
MATIGSSRVSSYVIVDAVGLEVPGHPVVDFFSLTPAEIAQHRYYDPERYGIDPSTLPPEARQAMADNRATLALYGGRAMTDPGLAPRLATITTPTLVIWGEADRIADPDYGRAYANAIPGAQYELMTKTGHMPQIETPQQLIDVVRAFGETGSRGCPRDAQLDAPGAQIHAVELRPWAPWCRRRARRVRRALGAGARSTAVSRDR